MPNTRDEMSDGPARPQRLIPTLAMNLQKPRPERWPLSAARASNAASKRKADGLSQASASNAANFGLHRCRGTFLQLLAMKLLRPVPQLWPNARLKTLQPSALAAASRADAMPNTRDEMSDDPARPQRNR